MKPLFPAFNVAVHQIAARLLPCGFDVAAEAPSTLEQLQSRVTKTGRLLVWSGASDATIFGDAETNYAFRAWHDWCHWRYSLPFNLDGEREAAKRQIEHVAQLYGERQSWHFGNIVWAEVVGQAEHFAAFGGFPEDQRAFTKAYMQMVKP